MVTIARLHAFATNGSNPFALYISPLAVADVAPSLTATPLASVGALTTGVTSTVGGQVEVRTDTSRQFRFRISASGVADIVRMVTIGWRDLRGRGQ